MSRSSQAKLRDMLEAEAKAVRLDFIDDGQFTNTGTYRFQVPGTFRSVVTIHYNFQKDYCALVVDGDPRDEHGHAIGSGYIPYDRLDETFSRLVKYITGWATRDAAENQQGVEPIVDVLAPGEHEQYCRDYGHFGPCRDPNAV